ncbi:MAG: hypothetical protein ACOCWR_09185 [Oceanidesulfovibrio sp.]
MTGREARTRLLSAFRGLGVRHAILAVVLAALLGPLVVVGYFNMAVYPSFGIEQYGKEEYEAAIVETAALYGKTIGFEAVELLDSEYRDLAPRGGVFCWGVVLMRGTGENAGVEQRSWISLKYYGGPWMRSSTNIFPNTESVNLLVDPNYELFFKPKTLPNFVKLQMEAGRLWEEQKRRFREVYSEG